jgi:predicted enzyme related to lactoylglutathione lyase
MVTRTVVQFEIPADDPTALSKFYSEAFGWKLKDAKLTDFEYWLVSTGPRDKSVSGGIYKKYGPHDAPRNYIGVDDIDEAIHRFIDAGGREHMGKQEVHGQGWSYVGRDPEGNLIALFQPMKRTNRTFRRRKSD